MSIKEIYTVKSIKYDQTKEWLLKKHYAKRLCSITFSFGLFNMDNILLGVCTFGSPPSRSLCIGICGEENAHKVYELNRLCVNDNLEKNVLSFFVSNCLRNLPNDLIIVSYADTKLGHHGYIYQATNFIYTGITKERTDIGYEDGKHSRHYDKNLNKKEFRKYRSSKHRYVYFTGNRSQIKHNIKKLKYKIHDYPKGQNQKYDATYNVTVQIELF